MAATGGCYRGAGAVRAAHARPEAWSRPDTLSAVLRSVPAPPRPAVRRLAPPALPDLRLPRPPAPPRLRPWRLAPVLAAALLAAAYLLVEPRTGDMAAHTFRAELFGREGFTLWNGQWYGGHHAVAYSVLFPPLAWLLSPPLLGVLSAVAIAALFEPLARARFGERARWGALWMGVGSATILFTGRVPFGMGVALGLGALLALQRGRRRTAIALALACPLASPVAGLFLALAGAALALAGLARGGRRPTATAGGLPPLTDRRYARDGALVAAAAFAPPLLLALAFPEGGHEPFVLSAFLPLPLFALAAVVMLPRREQALRIGAALYGLAGVAAFLIETPMGGNAVRLGALFGGPLLLSAVTLGGSRARRGGLLLLFAALAFWQWSPAVRDTAHALSDPAAEAAYYEPLVDFLEAHSGPGRVEIPFTSSHWEAAEVAPHALLARGWQRQLDIGRNPIFYEGALTARSYARWLSEHAVRFVALPGAETDYSSAREQALVEGGLPYLRLVARPGDWRVYEVELPNRLVVPDGGADMRLLRSGSDELVLDVRRPGSALLRVRYSPYWQAHGGCVEPAGDWTRVSASRPGRLRVTTTFSPERILDRGRRCSDAPARR